MFPNKKISQTAILQLEFKLWHLRVGAATSRCRD